MANSRLSMHWPTVASSYALFSAKKLLGFENLDKPDFEAAMSNSPGWIEASEEVQNNVRAALPKLIAKALENGGFIKHADFDDEDIFKSPIEEWRAANPKAKDPDYFNFRSTSSMILTGGGFASYLQMKADQEREVQEKKEEGARKKEARIALQAQKKQEQEKKKIARNKKREDDRQAKAKKSAASRANKGKRKQAGKKSESKEKRLKATGLDAPANNAACAIM